MTNLEKLTASSVNSSLFAETISSLARGVASYGRMCEQVNQLDEDGLDDLKALLNKQTFESSLDVILWLEQ